jgi:hypothetical protein
MIARIWPWAVSPQSSIWPRLHKRSTFTVGGNGGVPWNLPRWNGCHGLTIRDCWNPSATFPLPKLKKITIGN